MLIEIHSQQVIITTPAKINLFLEVIGKRPDGYHEIETVMCPVSLCDRLIIERTTAPEIKLSVRLPEESTNNPLDVAWHIPGDDRNLVVRAVQRVRDTLAITEGCTIRLEKNIPAAAGLGGGSSDAAAAIVGFMVACRAWNRATANTICASLGSDINFFLGDEHGIGMAIATGRGEKCQLLHSNPDNGPDRSITFCLSHPPEGCPTSAVYANLQLRPQLRQSKPLIDACLQLDTDGIGRNLYNALEPAASGITPWIQRQIDLMRDSGMPYASMSGSGSSCFALVNDPDTMATMRRCAKIAGLERVYAVKSWFAPPIEKQIGAQA